jgi:hypothetical protein
LSNSTLIRRGSEREKEKDHAPPSRDPMYYDQEVDTDYVLDEKDRVIPAGIQELGTTTVEFEN